MEIFFNKEARRTVSEANINFYAVPFTHPRRKMQEYDFIYLLDGEWKIGQGDEVYSLTKDTLLILCANETHYGASPCTPKTKTMYFHVSFAEGDEICTSSPDGIGALFNAKGNRRIKKIFYEIVTARLSEDTWRASVLFDLLLCELLGASHRTESEEIGEKIKSLIQRSPECFYSNEELARFLGVSVKTAESKFKALFGETIHQYVLRFKMEQAIAYFKSFPEMSVKEIAYNLGFYDEYHFSKQFKKIMGLSPSHYRNSI